jgi:hypothetical protein
LVEDRGRLAKAPSRLGGSDRSAQGQLSHDRFGANWPPCQKDADIAKLFGKAQAIYREIGKELNDVPLTGGGSDGNFTAALGIPDRSAMALHPWERTSFASLTSSEKCHERTSTGGRNNS